MRSAATTSLRGRNVPMVPLPQSRRQFLPCGARVDSLQVRRLDRLPRLWYCNRYPKQLSSGERPRAQQAIAETASQHLCSGVGHGESSEGQVLTRPVRLLGVFFCPLPPHSQSPSFSHGGSGALCSIPLIRLQPGGAPLASVACLAWLSAPFLST